MRARSAFASLLLLLAAVACGRPDVPRPHPNIVILVADDLGWNDVSYHGGPIATPRIDRFVAESMELDRFYVAPYCTPTRAGLLTGRYPHRTGLPFINDFSDASFGTLPQQEHTLAELLESEGYRERAVVGKWGLGHRKAGEHPLDQGFTFFYGLLGAAVGYFDHRTLEGELDWHRGRSSSRDPGYATDLIADESVGFIRRMRDEPFFLYVAFNAPHVPLQAKPQVGGPLGGDASRRVPDGLFPGSDEVNTEVYAAMVHSLDTAVGRVLDALEETTRPSDTLVLFLSDNGALGMRGAGDNHPLRGEKNTLFEGGIRVPAAIRWPGTIPQGRADALVSYVDIAPTLAAAAEASPPLESAFDGIDVLQVLTGETDPPDRILYYGSDTGVTRRWKLHQGQLFDLVADPGETTDLARRHPDVVAALEGRLRALE